MGANNSSNVINATTQEIIEKYVNKHSTTFAQKVIDTTEISQNMFNKFPRSLVSKGCDIEFDSKSGVVTKTVINTKIDIDSKQSANLMKELKTALTTKIDQLNKELSFNQKNKVKMENILNNLINVNVSNIVNTSFNSAVKQVAKINQDMKSDFSDFTCDSSRITFHQGMSLQSSLYETTNLASTEIQDITDITKINDIVNTEIVQKNIGINLTAAIIAAVFFTFVYLIITTGGTTGVAKKGGSWKMFFLKVAILILFILVLYFMWKSEKYKKYTVYTLISLLLVFLIYIYVKFGKKSKNVKAEGNKTAKAGNETMGNLANVRPLRGSEVIELVF
jgi:uncharacterized membrane protein